jgi:SAM-dependent methyltransferase
MSSSSSSSSGSTGSSSALESELTTTKKKVRRSKTFNRLGNVVKSTSSGSESADVFPSVTSMCNYSDDITRNAVIDLIYRIVKFGNVTYRTVYDLVHKQSNNNERFLTALRDALSVSYRTEVVSSSSPASIKKNTVRGKSKASDIRALLDLYNRSDAFDETSTVLEVGPGNGFVTSIVGKALGFAPGNVFGVEIASWMEYKHAASEHYLLPDNMMYLQDETDPHFPLSSASMDLVLCMMSIHHFKQRDGMLREIARVLKPNGKLIIREHDADEETTIKLIHVEHMIFACVIQGQSYAECKKTYYCKPVDLITMTDVIKDAGCTFLTCTPAKGETKAYWALFEKQIEGSISC